MMAAMEEVMAKMVSARAVTAAVLRRAGMSVMAAIMAGKQHW